MTLGIRHALGQLAACPTKKSRRFGLSRRDIYSRKREGCESLPQLFTSKHVDFIAKKTTLFIGDLLQKEESIIPLLNTKTASLLSQMLHDVSNFTPPRCHWLCSIGVLWAAPTRKEVQIETTKTQVEVYTISGKMSTNQCYQQITRLRPLHCRIVIVVLLTHPLCSLEHLQFSFDPH